MKNQLSTVTEVVVRSIFYIITNYVFVSMGLSFHTHWILQRIHCIVCHSILPSLRPAACQNFSS